MSAKGNAVIFKMTRYRKHQTAEDKIYVANFKKMLSPRYTILRIKRQGSKQLRSI